MPDETPDPEVGKKKSPLKTIILVVVILLVEAGVFIGVMMMHDPQLVEANPHAAAIEIPEEERLSSCGSSTRDCRTTSPA